MEVIIYAWIIPDERCSKQYGDAVFRGLDYERGQGGHAQIAGRRWQVLFWKFASGGLRRLQAVLREVCRHAHGRISEVCRAAREN